MGQDIRDILKDNSPVSPKLPDGHEARFAEKLKQSNATNTLPDNGRIEKRRGNSTLWLKIAAAFIIFLGIGYVLYQNQVGQETLDPILAEINEVEDGSSPEITIGDLSPDFKKVEDFYTAGINVQLASIKINPDNKELIDGYMKRLQELDREYKKLNTELNEVGPTEATITALVDNLKLRLELLFKLKNKLKELKQLENEQFIESNA